MTDYKAFLTRLHNDLNALRERQAKQAGNAPLSLLNQIEDYERAIALTGQARQGEIDEAAWQEAINPLLVSVAPGEAARLKRVEATARRVVCVENLASFYELIRPVAICCAAWPRGCRPPSPCFCGPISTMAA